MRLFALLLTTLFFICSPAAEAQESSPPDYAGLIGAAPAEALELFGSPEEIFIHPGATREEDAVVFFRDGLYLFWFENRVWQLRVDRNAEIELAGVAVGTSRAELEALFGPPLARAEASLIWNLESYAWPLRLRVFFDTAGLAEDIYLYRGDY